MRTAILGAGSMGTVLGAVVTNNGGDVTLIDANKAHVDSLNKTGATITGYMDLKNVPVKAITPDEMEGVYDLIVILLKQTANGVALPRLKEFINEDTTICTLQNGVPEYSVAELFGEERVVGGTVGWGAGWLEPGVSQLYTHPDFMIIEIGKMNGMIDNHVRKVEEFLKLGGQVKVTDNFVGIRWSKLLMNSALSGMSAACGVTFGDIIDDEKAVACAAHLADELNRVAEAKNIELEVLVEGKDFKELKFDDKAGRDHAIAFLRDFYDVHRPQKASMMQDMEKNIPCEIDYINGVVAQNGDELGIDTPFNDTVISIVKDFEAGKIPFPTMDCLERFNVPELK